MNGTVEKVRLDRKCQFPLKGSASIRVIVVLLDGWNGDWADVA
jgi:hypothetical protein